jgi:hypothetical protein
MTADEILRLLTPKPIAYYDEVAFTEHQLVRPSWIEEYVPKDATTFRVATCSNVDHPVLGFERKVHTSLVLSGDKSVFETLNTMYVKRKE